MAKYDWLQKNVYNIIMDGVSISSGEEASNNNNGNNSNNSAPSNNTVVNEQNKNSPIKAGPVKIYNGGVERKNVDEFKEHHSYHKTTTFNLPNGKKRIVGWRKSGWSSLFKNYLDQEDWIKYNNDSKNYKHIVYDLTIKQNGKAQPVAIYAPFNCKVVEVFGNPNSGIMLVGTGSAKGKTAIFLHVVPSSQNTNPAKQFSSAVFQKLKAETLNKTFKKGELIAYQGNWGEFSSGTHLHIESMLKEDFDRYITELPTFYTQ
jgi:hypothetical protein